MKNKIIIRRVIFLLVFLVLLFLLFIFNRDSKKEEIVSSMNYKYENRVEKLKNFDAKDYKKYGWLQVQGTNIDLPIVSYWKQEDPDYNFGWIVNTSYDYDNRKILSGHNVLNVSTEPMVNDPKLTNFEDLMAFVYYDFAKDNMYLVYTEDGKDKVYVIYAVGFYDYNYKYDTYGLEEDEVKDYINYVKKNSIYDYKLKVNEKDEIITIKTCTRMFGFEEKQQLQIDARLLRDNEKIVKYKLNKTELYEKYNLKDKYNNISS